MVRIFKLSWLIMAVAAVCMMCYSCGNQSAQNSNEPDKEELPTIGTLNGHDWVDLGLPSGTKWATCNVGASKPEDYGNYYAWGETRTKDSYFYDNYRWTICDGAIHFIKYITQPDYAYKNGYTDNLTTLEANDDAATANWGHGWRMPTETELQELISNCTHQWTTQNDVKGMLFTGTNGNSIFMPAAGGYDGYVYGTASDGFYWSSSLIDASWNCNASGLKFYYNINAGGTLAKITSFQRDGGRSVRPVCNTKDDINDTRTNKQDEKIEKELERQRIEEEKELERQRIEEEKEREAQRKAQEKEMELLMKVAEYREQQKMDLDGASADYYEALASFNNRTASNPFKFEGKVSSCNQKMNHLISIQNKIISIYKQIGDQELINEGIEQKKAYVRSLDEMNYNFERLKMGY